MYDSYFPGLSLNGPREREREGDEGSRLCRVYTARVRPLPAPRFTPRGRICAALCTCTYSTDVARNLPCGHSTSGEGLLTRATTFFFPSFSSLPLLYFLYGRGPFDERKGGDGGIARDGWKEGGGNHRYSSTFIFQGRIDFSEGNGTELFSRSSFHRGDRKMGNDLDTFLPFPFWNRIFGEFLENFWINKVVTFVFFSYF